jgi:hypothetical protein
VPSVPRNSTAKLAEHKNSRQTAAQLEVRTQVHRNQVQHLAQLGNQNSQLCYNFEHRELISGLVDGYKDPMCRHAVRGCYTEIVLFAQSSIMSIRVCTRITPLSPRLSASGSLPHLEYLKTIFTLKSGFTASHLVGKMQGSSSPHASLTGSCLAPNKGLRHTGIGMTDAA